MLQFFSENLANILIVAGLAAIVALIVANMIKKRKSGKSIGCGCGCEGCPSSSMCHKKD
ncbi:MAG: FeoB-associated Cys-rich membrane protein [Christensenellales bacterium]|jgi:hypothetical protein